MKLTDLKQLIKECHQEVINETYDGNRGKYIAIIEGVIGTKQLGEFNSSQLSTQSLKAIADFCEEYLKLKYPNRGINRK